jgi:hypothetical protein
VALAGEYRKTERNLGVLPHLIQPGLIQAIDDARGCGDIQMIDSSSIRVHQHAANSQKKTTDPVAWVARAAA